MGIKALVFGAACVALAAGGAAAHPVAGKKGNAKQAAFDIVTADIKVDAEKNQLEFKMQVSGKAGAVKPTTVSYTHLTLPTTPYV